MREDDLELVWTTAPRGRSDPTTRGGIGAVHAPTSDDWLVRDGTQGRTKAFGREPIQLLYQGVLRLDLSDLQSTTARSPPGHSPSLVSCTQDALAQDMCAQSIVRVDEPRPPITDDIILPLVPGQWHIVMEY